MSGPLLGLVGALGSGKDAVARVLVEDFGYTRRAWADALKAEVAGALHAGDRAGYPDLLAYIEAHKRDDPSSPTGWPRMLLQAWGMMRRDLRGEDYWVRQVPLGPGVVLTDCRFPNEVHAVRDAGGLIWRIVRPGHGGDGHISERALDGLVPDLTIDNGGTLDDLRVAVHAALAGLAPAPTA